MNSKNSFGRILALLALISFLLVVSVFAAGKKELYDKDWREFSEEPADSSLAENMRIWISVEKGRLTRLQVDILDSSSRVVRHFLKTDFRKGYFNIYWDRKDDSGLWVDEGDYQYRLTYPKRVKTGTLSVSYNEGERFVQIYPENSVEPGKIVFDLLADSARVTAGVYLWRGNLVYVPVVDSLMKRGRHEFQWITQSKPLKAIHRFHVEAFGYTHKVRISSPNEK